MVGLVQQSNAIVQDDIDRLPTFVFFTPALGKEVVADDGQGAVGMSPTGCNSTTGTAASSRWSRNSPRRAPAVHTDEFHALAPVEAKVDRTVKPLAIALGVFGGVAALAALLIGVQAISRQLRGADEDLGVLRALGAAHRPRPPTG